MSLESIDRRLFLRGLMFDIGGTGGTETNHSHSGVHSLPH